MRGYIMAVAGDALALALDDQAIAIAFHFMEPFRSVLNLSRAGRDAKFKR